jgi:hypothetical protein
MHVLNLSRVLVSQDPENPRVRTVDPTAFEHCTSTLSSSIPISNYNSAAFALHEHELALAIQEGDSDSVSQITSSLLALANLIIYLTRTTEDKPLDMPTLSYWSHRITYLACMTFIKYAPREEDWEAKIEICKRYLGQLTSRFRIYSKSFYVSN